MTSTDLYDMPGHLIRRMQQIAVAIFVSEVEEGGFDITPVQFAALLKIADNPGLDQATLSGLIAYDRTTIGGVIDRLVQKEYVARLVSDKDRRARELRLTGTGRKVLDEMLPAVERAQERMLSDLSKAEAREFMRMLKVITSAKNCISRSPLKVAAA